ncbi:MAG TPA: hypothetical protein VGW74_08030 [Propionibacteriaceae bacterium]|nr:hypothetical protein [Propionibacteriaceae bacterium]
MSATLSPARIALLPAGTPVRFTAGPVGAFDRESGELADTPVPLGWGGTYSRPVGGDDEPVKGWQSLDGWHLVHVVVDGVVLECAARADEFEATEPCSFRCGRPSNGRTALCDECEGEINALPGWAQNAGGED